MLVAFYGAEGLADFVVESEENRSLEEHDLKLAAWDFKIKNLHCHIYALDIQ